MHCYYLTIKVGFTHVFYFFNPESEVLLLIIFFLRFWLVSCIELFSGMQVVEFQLFRLSLPGEQKSYIYKIPEYCYAGVGCLVEVWCTHQSYKYG